MKGGHMEKAWYQSKTAWGSVLLAIEAGLLTLPGVWMWPEVAVTAVGTFLTLFGFRDALD